MDTKVKLIFLMILAVFLAHCLSLNFTQDDAFISYRYVENFVQGNGLVFNSGERVEGYTNFLWVIILSVFAKIGLDVIVVSKVLGIISGCATIFFLFKTSLLFFPKRDWLLALFPPFLLTVSGAFPYWSTSGLETSLFTMMVTLSVYLYLTYPRAWVITCALSALIRPEGALVFVIILLHKLLFKKDGFKEFLICLGGFVLPLVPFVIFKVLYYGDVLPNPFYAKTGFSLDYVKSGVEYFWLFLRHYGLWGIVYLMPILLYKRLGSRGYLLIMLIFIFTLYVIVIGGDVLKVHRFFVPIMPLLYLLLVVCFQKIYSKFKSEKRARAVFMILLLSISALFFLLPNGWIRGVRADEKNMVDRMQFVAEYLEENYGGNFSLAVTTIGSVSYYAGTGVKVIDMLGLTDRYISRHPEEIEGIAATWKEKRYNTRYVLSLDPDFIFFPTGYKPSAPAERALLLNSQFRENYYVIPVLFGQTGFIPIFKRKGEYLKENKVFDDPRFVDLFYLGVHLLMRGMNQEAIEKLKQAVSVGPEDFSLTYELIGRVYYLLKDFPTAETYLKKAININEYSVMAHVYLKAIYENDGRMEEAEAERQKVLLYDPYFQW